jgi:hypothetical protein
VWNHGELAGKILLFDGRLNGVVGESGRGMGSRRSQRWMKPSAPGAFSGEAGFVRVGQETCVAAPKAAVVARSAEIARAGVLYLGSEFMGNSRRSSIELRAF